MPRPTHTGTSIKEHKYQRIQHLRQAKHNHKQHKLYHSLFSTSSTSNPKALKSTNPVDYVRSGSNLGGLTVTSTPSIPTHDEQNSAYDFLGSIKTKAGERKSKAKKRRHTYNLTYQNRSNYKKFLLMGLLVTCAVKPVAAQLGGDCSDYWQLPAAYTSETGSASGIDNDYLQRSTVIAKLEGTNTNLCNQSVYFKDCSKVDPGLTDLIYNKETQDFTANIPSLSFGHRTDPVISALQTTTTPGAQSNLHVEISGTDTGAGIKVQEEFETGNLGEVKAEFTQSGTIYELPHGSKWQVTSLDKTCINKYLTKSIDINAGTAKTNADLIADIQAFGAPKETRGSDYTFQISNVEQYTRQLNSALGKVEETDTIKLIVDVNGEEKSVFQPIEVDDQGNGIISVPDKRERLTEEQTLKKIVIGNLEVDYTDTPKETHRKSLNELEFEKATGVFNSVVPKQSFDLGSYKIDKLYIRVDGNVIVLKRGSIDIELVKSGDTGNIWTMKNDKNTGLNGDEVTFTLIGEGTDKFEHKFDNQSFVNPQYLQIVAAIGGLSAFCYIATKKCTATESMRVESHTQKQAGCISGLLSRCCSSECSSEPWGIDKQRQGWFRFINSADPRGLMDLWPSTVNFDQEIGTEEKFDLSGLIEHLSETHQREIIKFIHNQLSIEYQLSLKDIREPQSSGAGSTFSNAYEYLKPQKQEHEDSLDKIYKILKVLTSSEVGHHSTYANKAKLQILKFIDEIKKLEETGDKTVFKIVTGGMINGFKMTHERTLGCIKNLLTSNSEQSKTEQVGNIEESKTKELEDKV